MEEQYSINEILNAIDELQNSKKKKEKNKIILSKLSESSLKSKSDIPSNTLRLIEEAEKTIRSKLQSE